MIGDYSLYFHLPFCKKKCDYCHFFVLPDKESYKDQLLEGLRKEWQRIKKISEAKELVSIYFGGGTPSLFGPERIAEILNWINPGEVELTLEVNPDGVSKELILKYARSGINRVSLGVQSFDDSLLQTLSRTHSSQKAAWTVETLASSGIANISIDLMYDIPGQSLSQWKSTLQTACSLPVNHISLYNLTFEPHTVFDKEKKNLQPQVPDDVTSRKMYETAQTALHDSGFYQYEISAFCKPGYESQHNLGYWTARPFLGLGPSAYSYWRGCRFRNIANLNKYCRLLEENKRPSDFEEKLELSASLRERFVINLRLLSGVKINRCPDLKVLDALVKDGLLSIENSTVKLTPLGILHYDTIASELI